MKLKHLALLGLVGIITGCANTQEIVTIYSIPDAEKLIVNSKHTINWTYCGQTESQDVLVKRNDGEHRSADDPLVHKFPMKWFKSHWFLVRPDGVNLPHGIQPGQQMVLKNFKFEAEPEPRHQILQGLTITPNKPAPAYGVNAAAEP